jgi:hypothetical protein
MYFVDVVVKNQCGKNWRKYPIMTQFDYEEAKRTLSNILLGDIDFEDKIEFTKNLQLLNLSKNECMKLYEYIDQRNTEYNILCFTCRNACIKSEQV